MKTGVLLVNLGTPDSTKVSDVRKYLREFLMDGRVIDIHPVARFLLVNGIIAPFRAPKSAHEYQKLWTDKGSPLMFHSVSLSQKLQARLDASYEVHLAMRYQNPGLPVILEKMRSQHYDRIVVFPLFPQYASATTGSVHAEVMRIVSGWQLIPQMVLIDAYPTDPKMIRAFAQQAERYRAEQQFDHVLFSYHGLPQRQLRKADPVCGQPGCCDRFEARNRLCYRAQCIETSRALAAEMGLTPDQYSVSFQSRLGRDPWIQPYTEDTIKELAHKGIRHLLVLAPSFVADCLETTVEIGETYKELFEEESKGGHFQMVESVNDLPLWVEAVSDMILRHAPVPTPVA